MTTSLSWRASTVGAVLVVLGLCASQALEHARAQPPKAGSARRPLSAAGSADPADVVVGAEVVPRAQFQAAPLRLPGVYRADIGGAEITLTITRVGAAYRVVRTHREPGVHKASVKDYPRVDLMDQNRRLSAPELDVMGVAQGLIARETKANCDGVPRGLWIFYREDRD